MRVPGIVGAFLVLRESAPLLRLLAAGRRRLAQHDLDRIQGFMDLASALSLQAALAVAGVYTNVPDAA